MIGSSRTAEIFAKVDSLKLWPPPTHKTCALPKPFSLLNLQHDVIQDILVAHQLKPVFGV